MADDGDERFQDVVGAFADGVDAGVAHDALVGIAREVTLTAVDLQRVVDNLPKSFGGPNLEHGRFEHEVVAATVDEAAHCVVVASIANALAAMKAIFFLTSSNSPDRLLELHAGVGMMDRCLQASTSDAGHSSRRTWCGRNRARSTRWRRPLPMDEDVLRSHRHVGELEPAGRGAADAALFHARFEDLEAGHVGCHQERRDLGLLGARHRCPRHDREDAGDAAVRDVAVSGR